MVGTLICGWCQLPVEVKKCGGSQELHYETIVNILYDRLTVEVLSVRVGWIFVSIGVFGRWPSNIGYNQSKLSYDMY